MNISFDLRLAHLPGGGYVYVKGLLPSLIETCKQASWNLYFNSWCQKQQQIVSSLEEKYPAARIRRTPVQAPCLSLWQHLEFIRFRDKGDLYHYPHFDMPLGLRHIPMVMTIHDLYPISVPGYCSSYKSRYFRWITSSNIRRAGYVIAISNYTRSEIIRLLGAAPEKITVIPQCVSGEYHPVTDEELLERVRLKYRLPRKFILYTGNHKPHKNLARLIKAYARLRENIRKEFPLVLTGAVTNHTRCLIDLSDRLGLHSGIIFLGRVVAADMPALYNLAALLVHPSLYEGFGLAPLEAMACGTAVVCSNAGAIPEVVGEAARRFDPHCIEDMTATIAAALDSDINNPAVRRKGLAQASRFTLQHRARRTCALYESLLECQGRVSR